MLTLPQIWPNETIYSLIAKIVRANGLTHLAGMGILTGEERPASIINCPVNMKHFCEATRGAYGNPRDLLYEATVFPALAHLGELNETTLSQVENGVMRPKLGMLAFGLNKGRQWRVCKECLERDRKAYGIAYWHRPHQLPNSYQCTEHGLILDRVYPSRLNILDRLLLPSDCMHEMHSATGGEVESMDLLLELSLLGRDALADKSEPFPQEVILATYKDGLKQIGLMTDVGQMRLTEFFSEFRQIFGKSISTCPWADHSNSCNPKPLLNGITDENSPRPFSRLLLTMFIFGSWEGFKERCKWQDMLGRSSGNSSAGANAWIPLFEDVLRKQRQVCIDYKSSRLSPTRNEFMKISRPAFRWLRNNDQEWLDQELPIHRTKGQGKLFE